MDNQLSAPKPLWRRVLWTLIPPIVLVAITPFLTLPGVDRNVVDAIFAKQGLFMGSGQAARNVSIFALSLSPIISAYALVELIAIISPRLSRLRHNNPQGRAKLDRAARVVALIFAIVQAWSMSRSLALLSEAGTGDAMPMIGILPTGLVMASLVGGVCVMLLIANLVTRQGIVNGIVFMMAIEQLDDLRRTTAIQLMKRVALADLLPTHVLGLAAVIVVPMIATWFALRNARSELARAEGSGTAPYRHARSLALHPEVPIPASSIAPYAVGSALVMLPFTLIAFVPMARHWFDRTMASENATWTIIAIQLAATLVIGVVLARLLHRPHELADLVSRLGSGKRTDAEAEAHAAIRRALPATLLFLATLVIATAAAGALRFGWLSTLALPVLVAIAMDWKTSVAAYSKQPDLVSIWQERRASAVPILRSVLEAEGITVHTHGTRVLRLLQVFAPYTFAELLVSAEDAPRASAILRHLLLGEPPQVLPDAVARPAQAPADGDLARTLDEKDPASISERVRRIGLALCGVAVLGTLVLASIRLPGQHAATSADHPRPNLEVVRVDDEIELFERTIGPETPPGIEIRVESAPLGGGGYTPRRNERRYFAVTELLPGETVKGAVERMRPWLATFKLPDGKRFGFEPTVKYNPNTGKGTIDGVRTYVLTGETILTTDDVVDAMASKDMRGIDDEVYVAVTLRPEAADRFGEATGEWTNRRIAIVLDGMISSAPVVRTRIDGGRISITMGVGDPEKQLAEAKSLASGLSGR